MDSRIKNILAKAGKLAKSDKEQDGFALDALKEKHKGELGEYFVANEHEFDLLARAALNTAWADSVKTDIIKDVIDTRTVDASQSEVKVEDDLHGLKARWQGVGGQIHSDTIRESEIRFGREEIAFALDYHLDELETDFWGTYSRLVAHGRAKMDGAPVTRLLNLVNDSVNASATPNQYLTTAKSSVTEQIIDAWLDPISDRSNGNVTLLGSRSALAPFGPMSTQYSDDLSDQYFRTGVIGVYKGVKLVKLENYEDEFGRLVLPDDEVWAIGEKSGLLAFFGSNVRAQTQQLPAFHRRLEVARKAGMRFWGGENGRAGRLKWS